MATPRIEHRRYKEAIKKAMARRDAKIKVLAHSITELKLHLGDVNQSTTTPSPLRASAAPEPLSMMRATNYRFLLPIVLFLIAAVIGMLYALCIWKHHVTQFMHSIECGNPAVRKSVQDARLRGLFRPSAGVL